MDKVNIRPNERVRAAMTLAGYNSYDSLAKSMGISISAFQQKISGNREFNLGECNLIANILHTTLDKIFFIPIVPK